MKELALLPLTKRQREILTFLQVRIAADGYAPSLEEIGQHFGLTSLATVHKHVTNLDRKGYLTRQWNRSRSIVVHKFGPICPLCGHAVRDELLTGENSDAART